MDEVQSNGWEHSFCKATVAFALDVSETTDTGTLRAEATFIKKVVKQLALKCQRPSRLILCDPSNVRCVPAHAEFDHLEQLKNLRPSGPARPALILQHEKSLTTLRGSTIWFLLTNGNITRSERDSFTQKLLEAQIHGTTLVTVKFGHSDPRPTNSGFELEGSLYALCPNYLGLFYDIKQQEMRVMRKKGVFSVLLASRMCPTIDDSATWDAFPTFKYEQLHMISVPAPTALAADEVILNDGFNSFRFADLLEGKINEAILTLLVVGGEIDQASFKPVGALALTQSCSGQFVAWAEEDFWDFDDFQLIPRVDPTGMARSAFLALSTAISEDRDQDHIGQLRGVLRQAHHANLVNFNKLCRDMAKLRGEVIVTVLSQSPLPQLKIGGPSEWVDNMHQLNNTVPADMGWTNLFWNPGFVADNREPFVEICTICGKENNTKSVLLLTTAASLSVNETTVRPEDPAGVKVTSEWPWEAGYATENDVLCKDMCCCDACSVHCLLQGFPGLKEKPVAIWPIAPFSENLPAHHTQLEQVFGSRFDSALAPMALLSVLLKAWKHIKIQEGGSSSRVPTGGSPFARAVFRGITYLLEGIQTDSHGFPARLPGEVGIPGPVNSGEQAPVEELSSSQQPDDEPILGKVYTGHVSIVWKRSIFVTLQGVKGNPSGRMDTEHIDDNLCPSQGQELRVKVIKADTDGIELSMKANDKTTSPVCISHQPTEILSLKERLLAEARHINGRGYRTDSLLDRLSLRAFALAFEATCVAVGDGIAYHTWARSLRMVALKRYLFCLMEGAWSRGVQNQDQLMDTMGEIKESITNEVGRLEMDLWVMLEENSYISHRDMDVIRGLSVFNDIQDVLGKAAVAFYQGLMVLSLDDLESISSSQWTVETVFDAVLQSPEISDFWEDYERRHLDNKESAVIDVGKAQAVEQRPEATQIEPTDLRQTQPTDKNKQIDKSPTKVPQVIASSNQRTSPQRRAGWDHISGKQRGLAGSIHAGDSATAARRGGQHQTHGRDAGGCVSWGTGFQRDHVRGDGDVTQRAYDSAQRNISSVFDSQLLTTSAQAYNGPSHTRLNGAHRQPHAQQSQAGVRGAATHGQAGDASATAEGTDISQIDEAVSSAEQASPSEQDSSGLAGKPAAEAWW